MIFKTLLQVASPPFLLQWMLPPFSTVFHQELLPPLIPTSWMLMSYNCSPFPKTRLDWVQTSRNLVSEGFLVYSYVNGNETSSTQVANPWSLPEGSLVTGSYIEGSQVRPKREPACETQTIQSARWAKPKQEILQLLPGWYEQIWSIPINANLRMMAKNSYQCFLSNTVHKKKSITCTRTLYTKPTL